MFEVSIYTYTPFVNLAECKDNFDHDFIGTHGSLKRLLVIYTRFDINTGQTKKLYAFLSNVYDPVLQKSSIY